MDRQVLLATTFVPALLILSMSGCGSKASKPSTPTAGAATEDHATKGPHGGSLIELGNEEYHAELVHDEQAKTVTVYILDSAAKTSVPIDAVDVTINLKHEGRGEQFKLAAAADQNDGQGKSSRFASSEAELAEDLDGEGAEAQLVVTINGKPYRGTVEHDHGHE
ncbi:MAG: hypothetical protein WD468_07120 [Pirellulales bacterium]